MKALSIRQPWAWLILHAGKDMENRSWSTRIRGRVLIHAGQGMSVREYLEARDFVRELLAEAGEVQALMRPGWFPPVDQFQRGGIVGSVEIVDCVQRSASPWFCGPYGFVLRDPKPLPFRPCRGALGFFDVQEAVA